MQQGESAGRQAQRGHSKAEKLRAKAQALAESADRIDRMADMWALGQVGEQTIGSQLELLRPYGFDVLHDVRWPGRQRANIDHVAIGPPGVLVVDAKNWSGSVTIGDGVVRQNGYTRAREVEAVRQAGRDVAGQLQLPWALHVIPVIALAGAQVAGAQRSQDVTVVGHRELVAWATGLPAQLTPGDVLGVAAHLRGVLPPASQPAPSRTNRRRQAGVPREPSARQRSRLAKRKAAGREALVKIAVLIAVVLAVPSLLGWWSTHGSDIVAAAVPLPTNAAASTTPSAPPVTAFATCKDLRLAYPDGVKRPGAKNAGKRIRGGIAVDGLVYQDNARLDKDDDGIVCERPRRS